MDDMLNIGYKPDIKYTDNWTSNIGDYEYINEEEYILDDNSDNDESYTINRDENINKNKTLLYNGMFPNELMTSINEVYLPLIDTYNSYIKDQMIHILNNETIYIENGIDDNPSYDIYMNYKTMSLKVGSQKTIKAYVVPTSNENNYVAEWISSDNSIAKVENGIVTGISKGRVTIKAISSFDKECECIVDVLESTPIDDSNSNNDSKDNDNNNDNSNNSSDNKKNQNEDDFIVHVNEVALDRTHILVKKGYTRQLYASVYPYNSYNKRIIWSSNKNNIATVSSYGVITGVSVGTCMITASSYDGNKSDVCFVTVVEDNINEFEYNKSDTIEESENYKSEWENKPHPGVRPPNRGGSNSINIPVIVINPEIDPTPYTIENEFKKNMIDIFDFYNNTLNDIINKYYLMLITHTNKKDTKDINFIYNDVNISNKDIVNDYRHLLDSALRTEKISDVKLSFLSNNFNFNQSLFHLKNFLVSYELRKKYYSIPYAKNIDKRSSISNDILKNTRAKYDSNYEKAYENLYRYLDSSLRNTSKVIEDYVQGIIAKSILTEKGGI